MNTLASRDVMLNASDDWRLARTEIGGRAMLPVTGLRYELRHVARADRRCTSSFWAMKPLAIRRQLVGNELAMVTVHEQGKSELTN